MKLAGSQVAISCVMENTPRMFAQALRLLRSIQWFGGELAQSRVMVCVVGGVEDEARRALESLGADVRIISRFHPANRPRTGCSRSPRWTTVAKSCG